MVNIKKKRGEKMLREEAEKKLKLSPTELNEALIVAERQAKAGAAYQHYLVAYRDYLKALVAAGQDENQRTQALNAYQTERTKIDAEQE